MNQQNITDFLIALGSVRTVLASEENGDPATKDRQMTWMNVRSNNTLTAESRNV